MATDHSERPSALLVWARAAVIGGAALLTGVVSHVSAGGLLPGAVGMTVLLALVTGLSAGFLLGPASPVRLAVLVLAGQGVVHSVLSLAAGHRGDPVALTSRTTGLGLQPVLDDSGRRVGSLLDQYDAAQAVTEASSSPSVPLGGVTHLVDHVVEQGPLMVAAHLLGAVVLGLWLSVGESALWALIFLAATRPVVLAASRRVLALVRAAVLGTQDASRRLARPVELHPFVPLPCSDRPRVSRRGPPVLLAA